MKKVFLGLAALALVVLLAFAADELSVTEGWRYDKNGRKRELSSSTIRFDVTGNGVVENVQLISTNLLGTALALGGLGTPGFASFKNLGPTFTQTNMIQTNIIEVGYIDTAGAFLPFVRLDTNQMALVWLATNQPVARAIATNSVNLDYTIVDR